MKVALIAHNRKKTLMIKLAAAYKHILGERELYATGTTDMKVMGATGLPMHYLKSGPSGGDQQVGTMISEDNIGLIIFLRDPLSTQPHEPDVTTLVRLSDVCEAPLATNVGSAEVPLRGAEAEFADFREVIREGGRRPLAF